VADAHFMDALRLLRAWDHQPLALGAKGELVGPAAARAGQMHGLAVQLGQRLSADFLSPAALERVRHAIGVSQASVPPLLDVRVHATDDAAAQHRGDQILALPWELVIVEASSPSSAASSMWRARWSRWVPRALHRPSGRCRRCG
jgi:hypothetical protein